MRLTKCCNAKINRTGTVLAHVENCAGCGAVISERGQIKFDNKDKVNFGRDLSKEQLPDVEVSPTSHTVIPNPHNHGDTPKRYIVPVNPPMRRL